MVKNFILKILRDIESQWDCISFAYRDDYPDRWLIAVDDYALYGENEDFKTLRNKYRKIVKDRYNVQLVFIYQKPSVQLLEGLLVNELLLNL